MSRPALRLRPDPRGEIAALLRQRAANVVARRDNTGAVPFHPPPATLVALGKRVALPRGRAAPLSRTASATPSELQLLASSFIAGASSALDAETFGLGASVPCGKRTQSGKLAASLEGGTAKSMVRYECPLAEIGENFLK